MFSPRTLPYLPFLLNEPGYLTMNAKILGAVAVALVLGACGAKQEEAAVEEAAMPAAEEVAPAADEMATDAAAAGEAAAADAAAPAEEAPAEEAAPAQ